MKHLISYDLWKGSCHDMAKSYCSKEKEYKLEADNSVQMTNLGNLKQIPRVRITVMHVSIEM